MKRFAGFIILILYITAGITAFADRYDELYEYTDVLPKKGSISADIALTNFKSLDFLSCLDEYTKPYSAQKIAEGLANSKIHLDIDYRTQSDKKIIRAHIKANVLSQIALNDELSLDSNALFHIWVIFNFTDSKDPYYHITFKSPMSEKYYVLDSAAADAFLIYPSDALNKRLERDFKNALRNNSWITAINNTYTLTLDDAKLKGIISSMTNRSYDNLYLLFNGKFDDDINYSAYRNEVDLAVKRLMPIQILGKSGITRKLTFSDFGKLSRSEFDMELDTNIFKLYYAATGKEMPADPNASKPAINADNSDINLKISVNSVYSDEYNHFTFPNPDDSLVYDIYRSTSYTLTYTTDDTYVSPYEIITVNHEGFPVVSENTPYIPLRTLLNSFGVSNEYILWNEGSIHIRDSAHLMFKEAVVSAGNRSVITDGNETVLSCPPVYLDGIIYVPEEFVSKILGARVVDYSTLYKNEYSRYFTAIRIERLKPVYIEQLKKRYL